LEAPDIVQVFSLLDKYIVFLALISKNKLYQWLNV